MINRIDACISSNGFVKTFAAGDQSSWAFQHQHFTKTKTKYGAGFHIEKTNIKYSYRLRNSSSNFQEEIFAIRMACSILFQLHESALQEIQSFTLTVRQHGATSLPHLIQSGNVRNCFIGLTACIWSTVLGSWYKWRQGWPTLKARFWSSR